jgi:3',5'-cyclic AMP phosphodiesterase CpdA
MKRFGWITDIHLNFLEPDELQAYHDLLGKQKLDGLLVSGDIAEAPSVAGFLLGLRRSLGIPIYFVLGNHDYYFSNLEAVHGRIRTFCAESEGITWLSEGDIVVLSDNTALVGHDSWADGRNGNYERSPVLLSDFFLIEDLANISPEDRLLKLNALGDEAARYFEDLLPRVLESFENVILVTHVPPFRETCWYDGKISNDDYLPHFSCKVVGEVLVRTMQRYPRCHLTVLCGHTHGAGVAQILDNLVVKTGGAEYGAPALQEVLLVG